MADIKPGRNYRSLSQDFDYIGICSSATDVDNIQNEIDKLALIPKENENIMDIHLEI